MDKLPAGVASLGLPATRPRHKVRFRRRTPPWPVRVPRRRHPAMRAPSKSRAPRLNRLMVRMLSLTTIFQNGQVAKPVPFEGLLISRYDAIRTNEAWVVAGLGEAFDGW